MTDWICLVRLFSWSCSNVVMHIMGNIILVCPSCGERETGCGVIGGGSEEPLGQRLVGATLLLRTEKKVKTQQGPAMYNLSR